MAPHALPAPRARRAAALALLVAMAGCSEGGDPSAAASAGSSGAGGAGGQGPVGGYVPGARMVVQTRHPGQSPHLGQIVEHAGHAFIANSFDAFTVYDLRDPADLPMVFDRPPETTPKTRCSTVAVHAASSTLFCGSERGHDIVSYDITSPSAPVLRDAKALTASELYVRDLYVDGDVLHLSLFDNGLSTAQIGPDGALSAFGPAAIEGEFRAVRGSGERLAALTSDRGLVALSSSGGVLTETGNLPIDGPPIGLTVRDTRAAVALGSAGVAVIDLAGAPQLIATVIPPAAVTAVDLREGSLVATTPTGLFVYDLDADPPRLSGFWPASGAMMDARFVGDAVLVTDWWFVERYDLTKDGHAMALDLPRGMYFAAGAAPSVPLRNPGDLPLKASLSLGKSLVTELIVPPGETVHVDLDPARVAEVVQGGAMTSAVFVTVHGHATRADAALDDPGWVPRDSRPIVLVAQPAGVGPEAGRPAPGQTFPAVTLARPMDAPFTLPVAGLRSHIVFFSKDCTAMWPQIEDAAWLSRKGLLDGDATAIFVSDEDLAWDRFQHRFGLDGMRTGFYGKTAPPEVQAADAHFGAELYESAFMLTQIPGGANHPTDYVVDEAGVVQWVERVYYGAKPLR